MATIGIDWGSSSFRGYLIGSDGKLLDKVESSDGIFSLSKAQLISTIERNCGHWFHHSIDMIVLSGMIGSDRGWQQTSYLQCPFDLSNLFNQLIDITAQFYNTNTEHTKVSLFNVIHCNQTPKVYIVPGLKCELYQTQNDAQSQPTSPPSLPSANEIPYSPHYNDVMRGEELQLLGAIKQSNQVGRKRALFCLPGTHSKWALLDGSTIKKFYSFLTGELFHFIEHHSSLSGFIKTNDINDTAFHQGLSLAHTEGSLLHHLFQLRAAVVSQSLSPQLIRSIVSGLIIGNEIIAVTTLIGEKKFAKQNIGLVGEKKLIDLYQKALNFHSISSFTIESDHSLVHGYHNLSENIKRFDQMPEKYSLTLSQNVS